MVDRVARHYSEDNNLADMLAIGAVKMLAAKISKKKTDDRLDLDTIGGRIDTTAAARRHWNWASR